MKKNLTYGPRLPFRKCGFEFTAEKRAEFKYPILKTKKQIYVYGGGLVNGCYEQSAGHFEEHIFTDNLNHGSAYDIFTKGRYFEKAPKWMQKKAHEDDCLECPSPIVKNRSEVALYFCEFEKWTKRCGLTLDLEKAEDGLGGCHIHISLAGLGKVRRFFVTNLINFVTNYPELNWGFNDPNDIYNANNLLTLEETRGLSDLRVYFSRNHEEMRILRMMARQQRIAHRREREQVITNSIGGNFCINNTGPSISDFTITVNNKSRKSKNDTLFFGGSDDLIDDPLLGSLEHDIHRRHHAQSNYESTKQILTNRYEMSIVSPYNTNKCGSINFNDQYDTVEFRIFDQPKNLTQHLLHAEVAQRIFDYCLKKAKRMEAIELKIDTTFFNEIDREKSIKRFNKCMKIIKVDPSRCKNQIANINQRFEWHKEDPQFGYLK